MRQIGFQVQQFSFRAELFCLQDLFFFGHQRHDPHGSQPGSRFDRIMVRQRGNRNIADSIDFPEKVSVHAELPPCISDQKDLSFRWLCVMRPVYRDHGCHAPRTVFFMEFACIFLPDKYMPLTNIQQFLHILFPDDVTSPERRPLEPVPHGCDIVTDLHSYRFLNRNLFHFLLS